jgi:FkbM family methyltransferase
MIRRLIKRLIPAGFKQKLRDNLGLPSQELSLKRLKALGFSPRYCLDIGAYTGQWTQDFKQVFPECGVLMIEGQREKETSLKNVKDLYTDVDYTIALLGANKTSVTFNKYETASSVLGEHNVTNAETETRELELLDDIKSRLNKNIDFIKIDTQGYELEIMKGGSNTVAQAEVVLLEVSLIDIYTNCPLVIDVLNFMASKGFVAYDIAALMRRPLDNALYQLDMIFVKENSRFRADKRWI